MPNYKEIARLKAAGQSNRAVAETLGLSRNTVNAAVSRMEDSGLLFEDSPNYRMLRSMKSSLMHLVARSKANTICLTSNN